MELRQLKYFVKAAELSNFTEAANACFITQSTLSQQIKQLEDELHIPLFDRVAKRVYLTEAGRLFLPYAQKTIKDAEAGKDILNDLMNLQTGVLNIGVTYGLTALLTNALAQFAAMYPKIYVNITFGTSQELLAALTAHQLDMVLSFVPVQLTEGYLTQPLFESRLALIVHRQHPLARETTIDLKQIGTLPLVLPVNNYSVRGFINEAFKQADMKPEAHIEVNDINTLLQLANTGRWCTLLMKTSIFSYPELRAVSIEGKNMTRPATITWPLGVYRKKAAIAFAGLLEQQAAAIH